MDTYAIVLTLHLVTLVFIVFTVFQADHLGFKWIRGRIQTLDEQTVRKYHRNTWIGLSLMIATGLLLFWPMREFLLGRPQFYIKMAFVLALIINGIVIVRLQKVAIEKSFSELTFKEKLSLMILGAVSTICWIGAILGGFFLIPK